MRESLESVLGTGIIGEVKGITANLGFAMSHVARLAEPSLAGGALLDVGVYTINFALMANKKEIKNIHSAAVFTNKGLDEQSNITLEFIDGSLAMLHSSQVSATDRRGLIFGTKGYIEVRNIVNPEWIRVFDPFHTQLFEIIRPPQVSGFEYQLRSCKRMIEKGLIECPEMPHAEILRVMHIMDTVRAQWNMKYPME
jgi:predicted dehydrogenase